MGLVFGFGIPGSRDPAGNKQKILSRDSIRDGIPSRIKISKKLLEKGKIWAKISLELFKNAKFIVICLKTSFPSFEAYFLFLLLFLFPFFTFLGWGFTPPEPTLEKHFMAFDTCLACFWCLWRLAGILGVSC